MNKNLLIVLAGGFLIALLVAIIVQASFGSNKDGVEIAVAVKALSTGTEIKKELVKWKTVPEDSVFEGSIERDKSKKFEEQIKGRLRRDVAAGEPILQSALTVSGRGNVLASSMEKGMRAVAIKVSAESMVGGFINPGDRVDVILTYKINLSGSEADRAGMIVDRHATETVLENVKILAIDQVARKEDDKAKVGRTVTLEVSSQGAEKVAVASEMGDLSLSLRPLGDTSVKDKNNETHTTDVDVSSILKEIRQNSGGSTGIVRVYSGDQVENINVRH
jgi:Flp pilus assembly protein CpaB